MLGHLSGLLRDSQYDRALLAPGSYRFIAGALQLLFQLPSEVGGPIVP